MEETEKTTEVSDTEEKKQNNMGMIIAGVVVVVLVGGLVWKTNASHKSDESSEMSMTDQDTAMNAADGSQPPTDASVSGMMDEKGVVTINLEAGSFYYKPNQIKVKKGDHVKIVMKSIDMMHNFNIDELNVKGPLVKSGNTATIEFTADKVGTFEYYCSVANHRQKGQVGTFVVEE